MARYYRQGELQNGQPLYYARDQVGTVVAVVDASGQSVGQLSYDSYGNITSASGTLPDYRYAGLYYHSASGLSLATYRAYDAKSGRWISRDPIRERGGINLYGYVYGNSIVFGDRSGLFGVEDLPGLPQGFVDFSAGLGDGIISTMSFGFITGAGLRNSMGISGGINSCSAEYGSGRVSGTALTLAAYAGGAIPKVLIHFTTAEGAAGIAATGLRASRGLTLFGDGIYATTGSRLFVPAASTIPILVDGAGFIRLIPGAAYLNPGSLQTVLIYAGYGAAANRDAF